MNTLKITSNDYELDPGSGGLFLLPHKAREFIDGGYTHVVEGSTVLEADHDPVIGVNVVIINEHSAQYADS